MAETKKMNNILKIPRVSEQQDNFGIYEFKIENCNVSIINSIRRTLITDIPTVCFNVKEYNELNTDLKTIQIFTNTTSLNNEILKQRLSCIPVHIKLNEIDEESLNNLVVEVNKTNTSDNIEYITTEDFKIIDLTTNKELSKSKRDAIFPKSTLTNDYILFARLKPSISKTTLGQNLYFRSKLFISDAKHNGQFNSCSISAYSCTEDIKSQQKIWLSKESELNSLNFTQEEIEEKKQDWYLHDSKRIFIKDSFNFKIESVGVYTNEELLRKACEILQINLGHFKSDIENSFEYIPDTTNVENSFDIKMENYDYTLGKVIEYLLNELYFKNEQLLSYVGFIKKHPHDSFSIIRIIFKKIDNSNVENIKILLSSCAEKAIEIFENLRNNFI